MKENKSGSKRFLVFICFLLGFICIGSGVVLMMMPSSNNTSSSSKTKTETVKVDGPTEISSIMKDFLKYVPSDGSNVFDIVANRKLYINMELDSIKKEAADSSPTVGYVDYEVYKEKYEDIYGDNYSFDEDIKITTTGGPDTSDYCNSYPSISNQNVLCWSLNFGIVSGELEFTIADTGVSNNRYIMSGTYDKTYSDGSMEQGTFKITYSIKDNKTYLKSIVLSKN